MGGADPWNPSECPSDLVGVEETVLSSLAALDIMSGSATGEPLVRLCFVLPSPSIKEKREWHHRLGLSS